jgi:hypothetical protein
MSVTRNLLEDLASIGATIKPAGDRLILRAGSTAIPAALIGRVRAAKADLLAMVANTADSISASDHDKEHYCKPPYDGLVGDRSCIIEWLDQHPAPSPPGRCGWCGEPELPGAVILPFGTEPGTHAWLHAECWPGWHRMRRAKAAEMLAGGDEVLKLI